MIGGAGFDELCGKGVREGSDDDMHELIKATVELDDWYLAIEKMKDKNIRPIVGRIDEKQWVFGFTDAMRARKFFRDEGIEADIIKIEPAACVEWIKRYQPFGIVGIRFNQGKLGWYISIKNLEYIMKMKVN